MTVDGELRPETGPPPPPPTPPPSPPTPAPAPVTRATVLAYATVAVLITSWVLFGWLVQKQGFVTSLGEGLGAAFTLLLIVSVIGTVRQNRRE